MSDERDALQPQLEELRWRATARPTRSSRSSRKPLRPLSRCVAEPSCSAAVMNTHGHSISTCHQPWTLIPP